MKIALLLTLARIFICPIFLMVYLFYGDLGISLQKMPYILLTLLTLCEITDVLDGILARKYNQVTVLGKILDPMADSIVRLSIFLTFTQGLIQLPLLVVLIFVVRDAVISTLRTLCAFHGNALGARISGKIKAIMQAVSIYIILGLLILYVENIINLTLLRTLSFWTVFLTAIYAFLTGVEYIWTHRRFVKKCLG